MRAFRWVMQRWVHLALWFRFREMRIVHHVPIPTDQPAILAGNHQNALLDSITLAACSPKVPYTLSRGSLFNYSLARRILGAFMMMPIYRFRDGFGKMRQNQEVFSQFVDVLRDNGWLLIFPEGSHFLGYKLRPLQRGAARIALAAQEAEGWEREIPIVPIGLQFDSHTSFGSRLLIQYGPPVSSLEFRPAYLENPKAAERALTGKLFQEMERLLVVLTTEETAYRQAAETWNRRRVQMSDLMEQFRADRLLVQDLEGEAEPGEAVRPQPHSAGPIRRALGYGMSLPGLVLHLPVLLVILVLERIFIKDTHLAPSARFAEGIFLTPLWYVSAAVLCHALFGSFLLDGLLLAALPFSLWLWSRTWHWTRPFPS